VAPDYGPPFGAGGALARAAYGHALELSQALLEGDLPRLAAVAPHAAVNGLMRP
jgi:hypothetical protein